jgi:hypothetical protein
MTRKTDGEKVDDLQLQAAVLDRADAVLAARLVYLEKSDEDSRATQRETKERLHELELSSTAKLAELQRATEAQLAAARLEHERQLAELRRSHEAETKLLKQQVEELKQEQLRWGARLWQLAIGLVIVVLGAALVTYLGLKK